MKPVQALTDDLVKTLKKKKGKGKATLCPNAVRLGSPDETNCMQVQGILGECTSGRF